MTLKRKILLRSAKKGKKLTRLMNYYLQYTKRDYSTLPDVLTNQNGKKIETVKQFEKHKKNVLSFFENEVYGTIPKSGFEVSYNLLESGKTENYIREQVEIEVSTKVGCQKAIMLIRRPVCDTPVPVIIGLSFTPNFAISKDKEVLVSEPFSSLKKEEIDEKRQNSTRWDIDQIIKHNCALVTCCYADFASDKKEAYPDRFASLFPEVKNSSAISFWGFGLSRMCDYVVSHSEFDKNKIAFMGHSRLGKTVLWAGANDERASLVILNDSGCMGANISRDSRGERVQDIVSRFPHWFAPNMQKYINCVDALTFDQHNLLSVIAPRSLYVASAYDDVWSDPQGMFNSLQKTIPVFNLYGKNTIPLSKKQPPVNTNITSESMGYHIRSGKHDVTELDWKFFLEFMDNL